MPEQSGQDKTESASAKRRSEAKEKGNVAKSADLNSVAVMFMGIIALKFMAPDIMDSFSRFTIETFRSLVSIDITPDKIVPQIGDFITLFAGIIGPVLILLLVAGLAANIAQVGFMYANKALEPNFEKLNPLKGLKRLFSLRSIVETIKGIIKIVIVGTVSYMVLTKHLADYWIVANMTAAQVMAFLGGMFLELGLKVAFALLVLALLDFAYQKYEYEKSLKMTKQEVKDEQKQYEGSAETKGRIRSAQRQASRNRMMAQVPDATVVVTNPTHIAVALKYDPKVRGDAPKVVAKGQRKMAEKIKQIARENNIPVIENKPLARGLYEIVEVGMDIPFMFYQVVAEVIVQVYKMQQKTGGKQVAHA